jgi:hypothetical protein
LILAIAFLLGSAGRAAGSDRQASAERATTFPVAGAAHVEARIRSDGLRVDVKRESRTVYTHTLPIPEGNQRSVHLRELRLPAARTPLMLIVVDGPAADGVWIRALLLGENRQGMELLLDLQDVRRLEDGLCIGDLGAGSGAAVVTSVAGDEAALAPHRYRASIFRWRRERFVQERVATTRGKYRTASEALRELNVTCTDRIDQLVFSE